MKTLFDTYEERHAFIIGLGEALCPWPPKYLLWGDEMKALKDEYHYYAAGRACGFLALIAVIIIAKKLL